MKKSIRIALLRREKEEKFTPLFCESRWLFPAMVDKGKGFGTESIQRDWNHEHISTQIQIIYLQTLSVSFNFQRGFIQQTIRFVLRQSFFDLVARLSLSFKSALFLSRWRFAGGYVLFTIVIIIHDKNAEGTSCSMIRSPGSKKGNNLDVGPTRVWGKNVPHLCAELIVTHRNRYMATFLLKKCVQKTANNRENDDLCRFPEKRRSVLPLTGMGSLEKSFNYKNPSQG